MSKIEVHPTRQRRQHGEVVREQRAVINEDTNKVIGYEEGYRVRAQLVLDRYLVRDQIGRLEWRAGDRFRREYELSGMQPKVTADLTGNIGGSGTERGTMPMSERQADARVSWRRACATLGRHLSPIAVAVCCDDRTAADWAMGKGVIASRASIVGIETLRIALKILADEYRMDEKDVDQQHQAVRRN